MPTFETIETSSSAHSSALTIDSIALTIRSVSSTRVPTGALRLMRNCASSDAGKNSRSEEHTSELQSLAYLVCRLLLEKKKKTNIPQLQLSKLLNKML